MSSYEVYADSLKTPQVLTGDDGTPYVVTDRYDDDGRVTFALYRFDDRQLAEVFLQDESEAEVDAEIQRRKRMAAPKRAEVPPDEPVSVIRVLEYHGPRTWVEETVRRSIHGTRIVEPNKLITGVTVSDFPRRV